MLKKYLSGLNAHQMLKSCSGTTPLNLVLSNCLLGQWLQEASGEGKNKIESKTKHCRVLRRTGGSEEREARLSVTLRFIPLL